MSRPSSFQNDGSGMGTSQHALALREDRQPPAVVIEMLELDDAESAFAKPVAEQELHAGRSLTSSCAGQATPCHSGHRSTRSARNTRPTRRGCAHAVPCPHRATVPFRTEPRSRCALEMPSEPPQRVRLSSDTRQASRVDNSLMQYQDWPACSGHPALPTAAPADAAVSPLSAGLCRNQAAREELGHKFTNAVSRAS
jgi:hypothetical protein